MNELNYVIVYVTAPNIKVAKEIGKTLVAEKLAACVSVIDNVHSIYHWQGKIEEEAEIILMIKTTSELISKIKAKILSIHPYEVPEIIVSPIIEGYSTYLNWISETTKQNLT